jgi:hypothetical protein
VGEPGQSGDWIGGVAGPGALDAFTALAERLLHGQPGRCLALNLVRDEADVTALPDWRGVLGVLAASPEPGPHLTMAVRPLAKAGPAAPEATPGPLGRVVERELRIVVSREGGSDQHYAFRVRWQADGDSRVHGEMRESAGPGPGPVIGSVAITWRRFADALGPLARPAKWLQGLVGDADLATMPAEVSIEIDAAVTGRPLCARAARPEGRDGQWIVRGLPSADWWTRIAVLRADLPEPGTLRGA